MKLVMMWIAGDGCTYSCENCIPVTYENKSALLVRFMNAATAAFKIGEPEFQFMNAGFFTHDFFIRATPQCADTLNSVTDKYGQKYLELPPEVFTVEEWFNNRGVTENA